MEFTFILGLFSSPLLNYLSYYIPNNLNIFSAKENCPTGKMNNTIANLHPKSYTFIPRFRGFRSGFTDLRRSQVYQITVTTRVPQKADFPVIQMNILSQKRETWDVISPARKYLIVKHTRLRGHGWRKQTKK